MTTATRTRRDRRGGGLRAWFRLSCACCSVSLLLFSMRDGQTDKKGKGTAAFGRCRICQEPIGLFYHRCPARQQQADDNNRGQFAEDFKEGIARGLNLAIAVPVTRGLGFSMGILVSTVKIGYSFVGRSGDGGSGGSGGRRGRR